MPIHSRYLTARTILFCAVFSLFGTAIARPCLAETSLTPEINVRSTWNDNLFLKKFNSVEVKTEPALATRYKSEQLELGLNARLADFRYFDTKNNYLSDGKKINTNEYDRTTYQTDSMLSYQATERLGLSIGGGWGQDYSVDSYWDDSRNEQFLLKRDSYNANTNFSYELTEVDSLSLGAAYAGMSYDRCIENFADYKMVNVNTSWQHMMLDGTLALVSQASWQHVEFDSPEIERDKWIFGIQNTKQDIYQDVFTGMLGVYWMPLEKFTMQAMAGANYTSSSIDTDTTVRGSLFAPDSFTGETQNHYKTGFTGMFDAAFKEKEYSLRFSAKQEFLPSTYGELRKTTSLGLNVYYELTENSTTFTSLDFSRSKSDNITNNKIDRDFWRVSTQYRYRFTKEFDMRLSYVFQYYDNKAEDYTRKANSVYFQLAYQLPLHF